MITSFLEIFFKKIKGTTTSGILQRFIASKGNHNSIFHLNFFHSFKAVIKAVWSPYFCVLTQKSALRELKDVSATNEKRIVTFEGRINQTSEKEVRGYITPNMVEDACY